MNSFETIFKSTFKFLSSLKLAVIVLLGLAYILALGTIYESLYGTAVAKERVYGTIWFTLVLFFLGVNVLCAALSRLPWKKHHIGFVVTHAGIIIILVGSVITQQWGIDGSMALAEGEVGDRVTLDEPLIQVRDPDAKSTQTWKARLSQNPPNSEKPWVKTLNGGGRFVVDDFYLHAQSFIKVDANGAKENPALEVV
ncbi:MAG: hypothetical protein JNK65_00350, partial [Deltaproteobacteria bacterium]|nr:hypothetical protein [Deltaproteobacteria bacterium]